MTWYNEDMSVWTKKQETNEKTFNKQGWGTKVYQKKNDMGGNVDLIRCDATMKNVDCTKLWGYFTNPPKSSMIKECKILETMPNGDLLIYWRFKLPLMSDRDNVSYCHREPLPDGNGEYISCLTVERDEVPPVKGVVRCHQQICAYWHVDKEDPTLTRYTEIDTFDLKGYMPAKLLNMTIASETAKEFAVLYKGLKPA